MHFPAPYGSLFLVGVRDLPLRDMLSLGACRMGLGCSGEIVPSSSSSPLSSSSPTRIWETGTSRVLLRNQSFRSARIDPSRRAVAEGYMYVAKIRRKNIKYKQRVGKRSKTVKNRYSIKIPYRNILHSYPLKRAVMYR